MQGRIEIVDICHNNKNIKTRKLIKKTILQILYRLPSRTNSIRLIDLLNNNKDLTNKQKHRAKLRLVKERSYRMRGYDYGLLCLTPLSRILQLSYIVAVSLFVKESHEHVESH